MGRGLGAAASKGPRRLRQEDAPQGKGPFSYQSDSFGPCFRGSAIWIGLEMCPKEAASQSLRLTKQTGSSRPGWSPRPGSLSFLAEEGTSPSPFSRLEGFGGNLVPGCRPFSRRVETT